MQAYNKHGIVVKDHDTIFDVGANIGLFSIHLASRYKNLTIHLFEPVNEIVDCLKRNCFNYIIGSSYHLNDFGLSDKETNAIFEFNPTLSMISGMYNQRLTENVDEQAPLAKWLIAIVEDALRAHLINNKTSYVLNKLIVNNFTRPILLAFSLIPLIVWLIRMHVTKKKVRCRLNTISNAIAEAAVKKIDLVKIDVEGAELDVLKGIEDSDWLKIRQFVIEVHDVEGRVNEIASLLRLKGYTVSIDQEEWSLHKLMNITAVYAYR